MKLINKMKKSFKKLSKDEKGQGATEYILLLVVVVGLVLLFGDKIKTAVTGKVGQIESGMDQVDF